MAHLQLQESDLVSAQWLHLRPGSPWRYLLLALLILALAATGWNIWQNIGRELGRSGLPMSLLPVVFLVLLAAMVGVYVQTTARQTYRRSRLIREPADVQWDEHRLSVHAASAQSTIAWEDYVKWKENERLFLVYMSGTLFQVIPKRIFGSPAEEQDFRRHLPRVGAKPRSG